MSNSASELVGDAPRELVSAIYVDAPDKSSGKRVQHIHIKYDGLGFIPLNELMKGSGVTFVTPLLESARLSPFS